MGGRKGAAESADCEAERGRYLQPEYCAAELARRHGAAPAAALAVAVVVVVVMVDRVAVGVELAREAATLGAEPVALARRHWVQAPVLTDRAVLEPEGTGIVNVPLVNHETAANVDPAEHRVAVHGPGAEHRVEVLLLAR